MVNSNAKPQYRLTLESLPADTPAPIRLRWVLKSLLRSYGFRATLVEMPDDGKPVTDSAQRDRTPDDRIGA